MAERLGIGRTKIPARRDVAMPSCKIALDLSRAVQLDLPTLRSKQKFGFAKIFGSCHLHGAAQIRRGRGIDKWHILGAPRFSPYLARFLLAVSGRKQIVAPQQRLIIT